jgi:apolipoprotein N-acyltransferase
MYADEGNYRFVIEQAARGDFGLLIGTVEGDPTSGEAFNAAMLLTSRGEKQQLYRKMHLVPFGEYLPLRAIFAGFVGQLVPADFTAGMESSIFELPSPAVRMAPLICFEDTLGELTSAFVRRGAQLLVNITNDGWFSENTGCGAAPRECAFSSRGKSADRSCVARTPVSPAPSIHTGA